ncbi:MAG: shikimate dehydrogenase [Rhodospirillales bacterium]|jgi:shikimate dehydrogenase
MKVISGKARVAGVMGWPVGHSRSPRLHGHWLREHAIDGAYVPLAVSPERLGDAVRGLGALGLRGCNVTVPHKEAVIPLLDRIDATARATGAVNTIVVEADGTLSGSNTDVFGFMENLREGAPDWRPAGTVAVVVGAGGAARAVAWALREAGATEVRVVNRTHDRAARLAADIGGPVHAVAWAEREAALDGAGLLVNTTTQGMEGQARLDLRLDALPRTAIVNDIVYVPLATPLLADAAARGNPVVDGLGMLLHQARPGFAAWFGAEPTVTPALRRAVLGGT